MSAPSNSRERFEDAGVAAIVYTDIDRDGALTGLDAAATAAFATPGRGPVIASGGVASLDDIAALAEAPARSAAGVRGIDPKALHSLGPRRCDDGPCLDAPRFIARPRAAEQWRRSAPC